MVFVKNCSIPDSILIANEVAHNIQYREGNSVIFKIDFAKAFDSVNWDFLEDTMRLLNFYERWILWIGSILRSARPSILINGSPSEEFNMQ